MKITLRLAQGQSVKTAVKHVLTAKMNFLGTSGPGSASAESLPVLIMSVPVVHAFSPGDADAGFHNILIEQL